MSTAARVMVLEDLLARVRRNRRVLRPVPEPPASVPDAGGIRTAEYLIDPGLVQGSTAAPLVETEPRMPEPSWSPPSEASEPRQAPTAVLPEAPLEPERPEPEVLVAPPLEAAEPEAVEPARVPAQTAEPEAMEAEPLPPRVAPEPVAEDDDEQPTMVPTPREAVAVVMQHARAREPLTPERAAQPSAPGALADGLAVGPEPPPPAEPGPPAVEPVSQEPEHEPPDDHEPLTPPTRQAPASAPVMSTPVDLGDEALFVDVAEVEVLEPEPAEAPASEAPPETRPVGPLTQPIADELPPTAELEPAPESGIEVSDGLVELRPPPAMPRVVKPPPVPIEPIVTRPDREYAANVGDFVGELPRMGRIRTFGEVLDLSLTLRLSE
jgi:nicotinate-nucleotide--dimethylbenzimidazole phosphoribosyltransferase